MARNSRRYKPKRLSRDKFQDDREYEKYEEDYEYEAKDTRYSGDRYEDGGMSSYSNYNIDDNFKLRDNGTLVISELRNKVFLPYKAEEVEEILQSDDSDYISAQEVIDKVFTKKFSYYKNQFMARFRESVELITKREGMSLLDGASLGTELFGKRYLHPAIISACKNLDELNVYLDCLDKNELDDFKIFEIKYEIPPMLKRKK